MGILARCCTALAMVLVAAAPAAMADDDLQGFHQGDDEYASAMREFLQGVPSAQDDFLRGVDEAQRHFQSTAPVILPPLPGQLEAQQRLREEMVQQQRRFWQQPVGR